MIQSAAVTTISKDVQNSDNLLMPILQQFFGIDKAALNEIAESERQRIKQFIAAARLLEETVNLCAAKEGKEDGYQPLRFDIVRDAAEILKSLLHEVTLPDIMPLPGGGIAFQWDSEDGKILSVSILGGGYFSYAFILGGPTREGDANAPIESPLPNEFYTIAAEHFNNESIHVPHSPKSH